MNELCMIIKDMVKPNFLNIRTSIQTYDRDAICCGAPCWRWAYHALHSADKWFIKAYDNSWVRKTTDRTYEAIGKHFNGNPYDLGYDILIIHGCIRVPQSDLNELSFDSIKKYLESHDVEGIVFWKDKEPICKIKRTDFGFKWPIKRDKGGQNDIN